MKKILSMTLALLMVLSLCVVGSVSAADDTLRTFYNVKYRLKEDGTATIVGCIDGVEDLEIPATVDEYSVTEIAKYAFKNNTTLRSVVIPEGVTTIGFEAFFKCTALRYVTLPDSLREIWRSAFTGSAIYTEVGNWAYDVLYIGNHLIEARDNKVSGTYTVKDGTVSIAYDAFEYNKGIEEVIFPQSLRAIGEGAFSSCENLKKADLPEGLEVLGRSAFDGASLESVTIPAGITEINDYVFRGCDFTEVVLHDGVTSIGMSAFQNCKKLNSITIPESVTYIGDYAFLWCEALENISLPGYLHRVGGSAFHGTAFYENPDNWTDGILYKDGYLLEADPEIVSGNVKIKDGTKLIADSAFYECDKVTGIAIPESVHEIGAAAFASCTKLASVNIPKHVLKIRDNAFNNCTSLTSILVPEAVTEIGAFAFMGCTALERATVASTVLSVGEKAFGYYYEPSIDPGFATIGTYDVLIRGYANSAAHEYAKANNLKFEKIFKPNTLGDVDGSGIVNIKDATCLQKNLVGLYDLLQWQERYSDVNFDGAVDIKDATCIQKMLAEIPYPINSKRVYFELPEEWQGKTAYIYCHDDVIGQVTSDWPGTEATSDEATGLYYAEIPAIADFLIFNVAEQESGNLLYLPDYEADAYIAEYLGYKEVIGEFRGEYMFAWKTETP